MGVGGKWRAGRERRGEGEAAKQKRKEHDEKGERWEEDKEGESCMREGGVGEGGS